jgi:hypothetical protein
MEAVETFEFDHGITAEIVPDEEQFASNPRENDNLAVIASIGSERFGENHHSDEGRFLIDCPKCEGSGSLEVNPVEYYRAADHVVAALGLRYSDYGSSGSAIHVTDDEDDVNGVAFVTRERCEELGVEPTREECERQMRGEIDEYDSWLRGDVYGIVVRDADGEVAESVWGFIGDPFETDSYIVSEAKSLGEGVAEEAGTAPTTFALQFDVKLVEHRSESDRREVAESFAEHLREYILAAPGTDVAEVTARVVKPRPKQD